jgi:hypothetical protein
LDKGEVILYFYIDQDHFPYDYHKELSIDDKQNSRVKAALSSADTWLLWPFRTYLELKDHYCCHLVDEMPQEGIILFFRGSVSMDQRPLEKQFWMCLVADSTWHPFSQVNVFQNQEAAQTYKNGHFIRHWPSPDILRRTIPLAGLKCLYYMGDINNLTPELKSEDWKNFLSDEGIRFICPSVSGWNDYRDVDAVIAIRSFDGDPYLNKPASKLINAWAGNVIFIGANESAYLAEINDPHDMVRVDSYVQLKLILLQLRDDVELARMYQSRSVERSVKYSLDFFRNSWIRLIEDSILPTASLWARKSKFDYRLYIIGRLLKKRSFSLQNHFRNRITNKVTMHLKSRYE